MPSSAGRFATPVRRSVVAASCVVASVAPSWATARASRSSRPEPCAGTVVARSPAARRSAAVTTGITRPRIQMLVTTAVALAPRSAATSRAAGCMPARLAWPPGPTRARRARRAIGVSSPNQPRARITPQPYPRWGSNGPSRRYRRSRRKSRSGFRERSAVASRGERAAVIPGAFQPSPGTVAPRSADILPGSRRRGPPSPSKERAIVRGRHPGHAMSREVPCPTGRRARVTERAGQATERVPDARTEGRSCCPASTGAPGGLPCRQP